MADVGFIVLIVLFFVACVAYVRGLDRIVRSTEESEALIEPTPRSHG